MVLGERLSTFDWIDLLQGARVDLKHTQTGREFGLEGPGRVMACPGGREEVVVGWGTLTTESSAGTRPGASVLVGTPFGALAYASARSRIEVSRSRVGVRARSGQVWFVGSKPEGSADEGPRLQATERAQRVGTLAAAIECERAAQAAQQMASELLRARGAGLGELAARHVRARGEARAACATALAAALADGEGGALRAQLAELARQDAVWRSVPAAKG